MTFIVMAYRCCVNIIAVSVSVKAAIQRVVTNMSPSLTLALSNNIIVCRYPTYSEYVEASIEWQQGDYQYTK